jgi:hypothetical protein
MLVQPLRSTVMSPLNSSPLSAPARSLGEPNRPVIARPFMVPMPGGLGRWVPLSGGVASALARRAW